MALPSLLPLAPAATVISSPRAPQKPQLHSIQERQKMVASACKIFPCYETVHRQQECTVDDRPQGRRLSSQVLISNVLCNYVDRYTSCWRRLTARDSRSESDQDLCMKILFHYYHY